MNKQQYSQSGYRYDSEIFIEWMDNDTDTELSLGFMFPYETRLWHFDPTHGGGVGFTDSFGIKELWLEKGNGERYYLVKNRTCVNGAYIDPDRVSLWNGSNDPATGPQMFRRIMWEGNAGGYQKIRAIMDLSAESNFCGCALGYHTKAPIYDWINR